MVLENLLEIWGRGATKHFLDVCVGLLERCLFTCHLLSARRWPQILAKHRFSSRNEHLLLSYIETSPNEPVTETQTFRVI